MGEKIVSICKSGVRYDFPIKIEKVWTDEARAAALEARRAKLKGMKDETLIDQARNTENEKDSAHFGHIKEEVANRGLQNKVPKHFPAHTYVKMNKQEPIASDEPVISQGAIVSLRGHKGKVLLTEGDMASVSWEDASISKVPINDLKYEGRVEKKEKD